MRKIFWLGAAIAMLGAAACGSDESSPANTGTGGADAGLGGTGGSGFDGGLGGSGGTSTGGTGGTGATGGSGGTGGTGSGDCTGVFTGECGTCLESFCCTELAACNDTAGCVGCIQGDSTLCDADNQATAEAVITCAQTDCQVECFGAPVVLDPACDAPATAATQGSCVTLDSTITCNPVTNEPCDTAGGEACDADSNGGFSCFPAPNTESLCAACDATNGPWCKGTSTCVGTASGAGCARYCCDDTDCVPGTCDKDTLGMAGGVGVCVVGSGGTGGAGGAGGAGGDGGAAGASTGGAAGASTGGAAGASTGGSGGS